MRLTTVILIASMLQVSATGFAQKITIDQRDANIVSILREIRKQSGFDYYYDSKILPSDKKVSLSVKDASLDEALSKLFKGLGLTFEIEEKTISISKKTSPVAGNQSAFIDVRIKVIGSDGKPLPGASAKLKSGKQSGMANTDGLLNLNVSEGDVLIVTFIGYQTKEVTVTAAMITATTILVTLVEVSADLESVVVTGLFNKPKESYTGAYSTITAKELQAYRGQNLIQTLRNIDPAINIIANNSLGSNPNAVPEITMRGSSSLPLSVEEYNNGQRTAVNTPLVIMDGFEISLTKLMDFNDQDIESINILKDASATAIYGSRGANGVIVIITKQPQAGKLRINAQISADFEIPDLSSYELLSSSELLGLQNTLGLYNHSDPATHSARQLSYEMKLKDVLGGTNTDWMSYATRTGISTRYNLRLEGGSNEFRWGVSGAANKTAGAMKGSDRNNFNGTITLSYTYNNLVFRNQLNVGVNKAINSKYGSFDQYVNMQPYYRPYDSNGTLSRYFTALVANIDQIGNPLYDATLNTRDESKYLQLINNFSLDWNIGGGLRARAQFGISRQNNESDKYLPASHSTFLDQIYQTGDGYFRKGSYAYTTGNSLSYDGNVNLSYSKALWKNHVFYLGADYSMNNSNNYSYTFNVEGFSNENMDFLGNALQYQESGLPTGSESTSRRVGFTGTANYTYDSRYFADFSYRLDGSSQFGSNKRFAPFWSAGVGWNLHKENFLKDLSSITSLRLRGSYGQTGSLQFSAYQALQTFEYFSGERYLNRGGNYLMALGNENLTWQTTNEFNLGAEITAFNSRVTGTLDYYIKETSDLLSSRDLPRSTGFPSYIDNIGSIQNTGIEGSLNVQAIRNTARQFTWTLGVKVAQNKNKITKLSEAIKAQNELYRAQDVDVSTLFQEGYSQRAIWAVRSLGIDPSTGKELYLDADGNITEIWNPGAKVYTGIGEPLYRGNLSSMLRYKGLTLNLSFAYHWGGKVYNQTIIDRVEVTPGTVLERNVDSRVLSARWMQPGDVTAFKGFSTDDTRATTRFVMDDTVFQLQAASLNYRFENSEFLRRAKVQSATFGINMSDLLYLSSVHQERGTGYPFARRIGASLTVQF